MVDNMSCLIKLYHQVQLEPKESGYEVEYFTFGSLPDMKTIQSSRKTKKTEVNDIDEASPTEDENLPLALS